MITRVRLASAALLMLVGASVAQAQQADTTLVDRYGMKPARGAVGFQIGVSQFLMGGPYGKGAQPRFSFTGSFRYISSRRFGWQVNPYFTWAGYGSRTHTPFGDPANTYLSQIIGGNGQLLRLKRNRSWAWHAGAGPAVYRVVVQKNRSVVKDPATFRLHQGTYLGATAEVGTEHFLTALTTTSLEWTAGWHMAWAMRKDQFPSGFNANPQAVELRFGAHYYFDPAPAKKPGAAPAGIPPRR